jgi:hypothetical protein
MCLVAAGAGGERLLRCVCAFCVFFVVRVASTAIGVDCGAGRVFERLSIELHLFVAPARL